MCPRNISTQSKGYWVDYPDVSIPGWLALPISASYKSAIEPESGFLNMIPTQYHAIPCRIKPSLKWPSKIGKISRSYFIDRCPKL
jgi:hypothetical protein